MDVSSLIASGSIWLWSNYGKDISNKAIGVIKKQWEIFGWSEAELNYRQ
jgi:hypothetical protein